MVTKLVVMCCWNQCRKTSSNISPILSFKGWVMGVNKVSCLNWTVFLRKLHWSLMVLDQVETGIITKWRHPNHIRSTTQWIRHPHVYHLTRLIIWNKYFQCPKCHTEINNNCELMSHLFSHVVEGAGEAQCPYCLTRPGSEEELHKHLHQAHPNDTKSPELFTYACLICEVCITTTILLMRNTTMTKPHITMVW